MLELNASARIMYEEAQTRAIKCTLFGDRQTILMEKNGASWYTRGSRTSLQSSVGKTIGDNKFLTKRVLEHFQLPTAHSVLLKQKDSVDVLDQLHFPVVVKPLNENHGKGVVVGLQTKTAVAQVQTQAQQTLLVEELLIGTEYRVVCVNFTFVAAAFRKAAFVTGDGTHTIAELIELKNQHPWRGEGHQANLTLITIDELVTTYLQEQGVTLSAVPPAGTEIALRKTAGLSTGGEAWDVTEQVSPHNRALFEKIARVCDLNTVGIDVMCRSLTEPIEQQPHAGVIEVNPSPGLRMHHYPIDGQPLNVAGKILDMVETHYASSNL